MKNIKNILVSLAVGTAVITGTILAPNLQPVSYANIKINGIIDQVSSDELASGIKQATEAGAERILVSVNSPGGEVFSGREGVALMERTKNVDVYVSSWAASMGSDIFMAAHRRYAERNALVLFHSAHGGDYLSGQAGLTKLKDILTSPEFIQYYTETLQKNKTEQQQQIPDNPLAALLGMLPPSPQVMGLSNDVMDQALVEVLTTAVMQHGYSPVLNSVVGSLEMITAINDGIIMRFDDFITKSNGKWSRERVRHEIFGDFKKDMIYTGEQLMKMGLLTATSAPDMKPYEYRGSPIKDISNVPEERGQGDEHGALVVKKEQGVSFIKEINTTPRG